MLDYGGTNVFSVNAGDDLQIKYTNAAGPAASTACETTGFLDQAVDMYSNIIPKADTIVASTALLNAPLVIDNVGVDIGGNAGADNLIRLRVYVRIHQVLA